jgi:ferredoxin-NADP reductase
MKLGAFLACALLLVSGGVGITNALALIAPVGENCGNGIF